MPGPESRREDRSRPPLRPADAESTACRPARLRNRSRLASDRSSRAVADPERERARDLASRKQWWWDPSGRSVSLLGRYRETTAVEGGRSLQVWETPKCPTCPQNRT